MANITPAGARFSARRVLEPAAGPQPAGSDTDRIDEIARVAAAMVPLDAVLQRVVSAAIELTAADYAAVWLADETGAINVAAALGAIAPRRALRLELPESLARAWLERSHAVRTRLDRADDPLRALAPLAPGAANLVAPMVAGGRVIGGLCIGHRTAVEYDAEFAVCERIALHAAVAITCAELRGRADDLALADPVTGLPNRRRLDLFLDKEFAAARRGRRLAVLRLDIATGPTRAAPPADTLIAIATIVRAHTRAMNLTARLGDATFIMALSDADRRAAFTHARRIAASLRNEPTLAAAGVEARFGIGTFNRRMRSPAELLEAAEADLTARNEESGARLSI